MIEVTCPKCQKQFQCEKPPVDIVMSCPYCSAKIGIKVNTPQKANEPTPAEKKLKNVKILVAINNICWVLVGLYLIYLGLTTSNTSFFVVGAWNTCIAVREIYYLKNYYIGNYLIPQSYENNFYMIVIFAVANLIIHANIGVLLCIFNLVVRHYILKNRWIFENNG